MLKKLLKHEFIATWRISVILYAAILGLAVVARISILADPEMTSFMSIMSVMLYAVITISSFVIMLVFMVQRFYKNLLSNQAYLTLMVPAGPHQHLFAKIISTLVWYVGLIIIAFFSIWIVAGSAFLPAFGTIIETIGEVINMPADILGIAGGLIIFHLIFLIVLSLVSQLFVLYLCTTIGGQSGSHKRLLGVAIYILFYIVSNIIMSVLSQFSMSQFLNGSVGLGINVLCIGLEVFFLAVGAGCYFYTARRLTHNFNLQ